MKPHTNEELIQRLKEIAAEEVPLEKRSGWNAMCYRMAIHPDMTGICDMCNKTFTYFAMGNENAIPETVNEIVELGYDAKVQVLCEECAQNIKDELYPNTGDELVLDDKNKIYLSCSDRNFLFYFRAKSEEPYHRALIGARYDYKLVLAFLEGKSSYRYHGKEYLLKDYIKTIEFMTGLKIDE